MTGGRRDVGKDGNCQSEGHAVNHFLCTAGICALADTEQLRSALNILDFLEVREWHTFSTPLVMVGAVGLSMALENLSGGTLPPRLDSEIY